MVCELLEERRCRERANDQQRGRCERGLGLYSLWVVSVQRAFVRNDWSVGAARWGRRHGLSPVVWVRSSLACCANRHGIGFSRRALKS
jgi:hypothetical protein